MSNFVKIFLCVVLVLSVVLTASACGFFGGDEEVSSDTEGVVEESRNTDNGDTETQSTETESKTESEVDGESESLSDTVADGESESVSDSEPESETDVTSDTVESVETETETETKGGLGVDGANTEGGYKEIIKPRPVG